jgi:deoxyhypusine monooxygenase
MAPHAVEDAIYQADVPANDTILALRKSLTDEGNSLAVRFRALFSLKHLATQPETALAAIRAIAAALSSQSALLKHELAYCLGQTKNPAVVPFLRAVLAQADEEPMCRHEAAEALAAVGDVDSLDLLRAYRDDAEEPSVVRETCDVAVAKLEWEQSAEGRAELLRQR